jgi:uncharacterized membrane protein
MSVAHHPVYTPAAAPRWLLLTSLALNLFFVGTAGTILIRGYLTTPAETQQFERSVDFRIERIATSLPSADAALLRAEFAARRGAVEAAHDNIQRMREKAHAVLRKEPFDVEAMRAAMADIRTARNAFDQAIHGVVLAAATKMSPEGRRKLAEPRPPLPPGAR